MKAVVTGATGHVGSSLVHVLLGKGYEVHCFVRESSNLKFLNGLESDKIFFIMGDLRSPKSILECIKNAEPDYVFHAAAALGRWAPWQYFYELNVRGTQYVVDAIEKVSSVKKLLHISTFAVYGYENHLDITEDQPYGRSHHSYSRSKMMAEIYLREKYNDGKGLPISILRPPSVLGPHDRKNLTEILKLIKYSKILLPGKGEQQNSWAYTYDIADLLVKMAENEHATGEVFNIKTGDISSRALVEKIMELMSIRDVHIKYIPTWLAYIGGWFGSIYGTLFRRKKAPLLHRQIIRMVIHHHTCNIEKAKRLLDWSPKFSLDKALQDTIDWFIESGTYNAL